MSYHDNRPLKAAAEKAASKEVARWLCGECGRPHEAREKADACCVCKCGKNVLQKSHGSRESECDACTIKSAIRYAQESIKKNKQSLKSSEENLVRLRERKAQLSKTDLWVEEPGNAPPSK